MKKMKTMISLFTAAAMMLAGSMIPAFAEENPVVSHTVYEEITDVDTLIAMAARHFNTPALYAAEDETFTYEVKDEQLTINQLLSETEYANGTTNQVYVQNVVTGIDDNYVPVPASTYVDEGLSHDKTGYGTLCTAVSRMYITVRTTSGLGIMSYQFNKGSTIVTYNNTGDAMNISMELGLYDGVTSFYDDNVYNRGSFRNAVTNGEYVVTVPANDFISLSEYHLYLIQTRITNSAGQAVISINHGFDGTHFL